MTPERQRLACRPDDLLPGARSLIVVGASYASSATVSREAESRDDSPHRPRRPLRRGTDYHDLMKARLRELAAYVGHAGGRRQGPGVRTRVFVDASPLVERAAAVRAGLGFVGKNTNLLTADAGLVAAPRGHPDRPAARARSTGLARLRPVSALPGCLPDRCATDPVRPRRQPLHLVLDDRAQGLHPRRTSDR
jgi:hypothetical protein